MGTTIKHEGRFLDSIAKACNKALDCKGTESKYNAFDVSFIASVIFPDFDKSDILDAMFTNRLEK